MQADNPAPQTPHSMNSMNVHIHKFMRGMRRSNLEYGACNLIVLFALSPTVDNQHT